MSLAVIENSNFMRFMIKEILRKKGIKIDCLTDVTEAGDIKCDNIKSVIFGIDYFEIEESIEAIKKIKNKFPKTKIVAYSSVNDKSFIKRVIESGADKYIIKPFLENTIINAVNSLAG